MTDEVLREVYKVGYTNSNIIIIEDKESAIQLSEDERAMTLLDLFDDYIKDYAKLVGHATPSQQR